MQARMQAGKTSAEAASEAGQPRGQEARDQGARVSGSWAAIEPGSQACSQASRHAARQPGMQPGSQACSQAARQPGSQAARQPGSRAAGQPGSSPFERRKRWRRRRRQLGRRRRRWRRREQQAWTPGGLTLYFSTSVTCKAQTATTISKLYKLSNGDNAELTCHAAVKTKRRHAHCKFISFHSRTLSFWGLAVTFAQHTSIQIYLSSIQSPNLPLSLPQSLHACLLECLPSHRPACPPSPNLSARHKS